MKFEKAGLVGGSIKDLAIPGVTSVSGDEKHNQILIQSATLQHLDAQGNWAKALPRIPGPGPKSFIGGNINAGFLGEVSSSEMFGASELTNLVGLSGAGGLLSGALTWLKFAYKGRIVYIPLRPLRYNISWVHIYEAGAVYGTDNSGPYRFTGGSYNKPVVQNAIVSKNGNSFRVKLPTGASSNPTDLSTTAGSEWDELLAKVHYKNGTWASYSDVDMATGLSGTARACWCIESESGRTNTHSISRGYSSYSAIRSYAKTDTGANRMGWRPLLELMD